MARKWVFVVSLWHISVNRVSAHVPCSGVNKIPHGPYVSKGVRKPETVEEFSFSKGVDAVNAFDRVGI